MAVIRRPLQFDNDEPSLTVNPEKIDAAITAIPARELLGDDERVRRDYVNVISEKTLKVAPFEESDRTKIDALKTANRR